MATLRLAGLPDKTAILKLIKELFESSVYSKAAEFDPEDTWSHFERAIKGEPDASAVILLLDEGTPIGILACSAMVQMFNSSEKTGVELAFWITPGKRTQSGMKKLLKAYRYWCRKTKCTSILMGKMKNSDSVETYSIRKLKWP